MRILVQDELVLGVDLGYHQKINGWFQIRLQRCSGDQSIPLNSVSGGTFDLGFGAYYNTDQLYVGISAQHLTEGDIKYSNITTSLARHYYLMAGYNVDLTSSLTLKPMVMLKSDAVVSTQADFNANLGSITVSGWGIIPFTRCYRSHGWIRNYSNLKLGYSYDLTTSDIKTYSSGSHEVMLGYCFKTNKVVKRQFHRNVRFLIIVRCREGNDCLDLMKPMV